ncbi:MAG: hypothetical protein KUG78_04310 [Kangiellaceae bacterium]|nr:hypothetical protein [Kangiellaceae bacterium]
MIAKYNCPYFFSMVFIVVASFSLDTNAEDELVIDDTIHMNADNSEQNGITKITKLCGNALLKQLNLVISADCLVGKQREDNTYEYISATGNPATLTQVNLKKNETLSVQANGIKYLVSEQRFVIQENAVLAIENRQFDSVRVTAELIELDNKVESNRTIIAKGKPLGIELKKLGQTELNATSKNMNFNTGTSKLELSQDVIANLELGKITAGEFKYNSETKESSFNRSSNEQVEIIQKKKNPQ